MPSKASSQPTNKIQPWKEKCNGFGFGYGYGYGNGFRAPFIKRGKKQKKNKKKTQKLIEKVQRCSAVWSSMQIMTCARRRRRREKKDQNNNADFSDKYPEN